MRWAHSLPMQCARQPTAEEVDRRVLDVNTAYNLHTRLVVHLIPMSNFVNFEKELGDGNQVVSQGALRLKSLIKYYGNGRFQVLCELDPEENCAGLPYERAVFKVSANVLGSHLKLDGERPVTMFDCLYLVKRFHVNILLPSQLTASRQRGNPNQILPSLKEMLVNILKRAEIWVPGNKTSKGLG